MKYKFFDKKGKEIGVLQKNTILIGKNGSGKSMTLKTFSATNKIKNDSNEEFEVDVITLTNDSIKDSVEGRKPVQISFITEKEEALTKKWNEKLNTSEVLKNEIKKFVEKENNNSKPEEIYEKIKITSEIESFSTPPCKQVFKITMGEDIWSFNDIKNIPTGLKRLIEIYFSYDWKQRTLSRKKQLVLLDELDNFLHPSWIKLVAVILKKMFDDDNHIVVVSTHNPELLYLLNEHIKCLALPNSSHNSPKYIDLKKGLEFYNNTKEKDKQINDEQYIRKLETRFSIQLTRFLFSKGETVIMCEGITDQMFFKRVTSEVVINAFGAYNFLFYLSLYKSIYDDFEGIKIIVDGDQKNNLYDNDRFPIGKMLIKHLGNENVFVLEKDLEQTIFGEEKTKDRKKKFQILEKN